MKNVLYIAPIYDGTGYAHMANNTILTLDRAGFNVVVRKVKLTGQVILPPKRVLELEAKPLPAAIDYTIQHMLPPLMTYNRAGGINIGYFHCETNNFKSSGWQHNLNLMDRVWVSAQSNKLACDESGVKVPVDTVKAANWPYDGPKTTVLTKDLNIPKNTTVFYNIGDYSARKGMRELIKTYLKTFTSYDDVMLILKTYIDGKSPEESLQTIHKEIDQIKNSLRLSVNNNYARIIVLPAYMEDSYIEELHGIGDIFITLEKGAAWNIPAMEAYNHGNFVVCTDQVQPSEFLPVGSRFVDRIESTPSFVYGMERCTYPGIYTASEVWFVPDEEIASQSMRCLHEEVQLRKKVKHTDRILDPDIIAAEFQAIL